LVINVYTTRIVCDSGGQVQDKHCNKHHVKSFNLDHYINLYKIFFIVESHLWYYIHSSIQ